MVGDADQRRAADGADPVERVVGLHGVAWGLLVTQILATTALTLLNCRWIGQPAGRLLLDAIGRGVPPHR